MTSYPIFNSRAIVHSPLKYIQANTCTHCMCQCRIDSCSYFRAQKKSTTMKSKIWTQVLTAIFLVACPQPSTSFVAPSTFTSWVSSPSSSSASNLTAAVSPTDDGAVTVGVIGRGFVSVLVAKLAAERGYGTFFICPPGEQDTVMSLLSEEGTAAAMPNNLELIEAADSDAIESKISDMSALLIAVDDTSTLDSSVVQYLLNPDLAKNCQRVVGMSRNLNGDGMGFVVRASKAAANSAVWDNSNADDFRQFESTVKNAAEKIGAETTIVRAGTLKGGACGEMDSEGSDGEYCPQYLSRKFYELTKKDIVNFNLLFDCNVRGVALSKGDTLPGPGFGAVFAATAGEECLGDTSRCGCAEAMVRCLERDECGDMDFGVATREARVPPSEEEWSSMFDNICA